MKTFKVFACVRKVGAIGSPYNFPFYLSALSKEDVKEEWFSLYSDLWEVFHFESIEECNPEIVA